MITVRGHELKVSIEKSQRQRTTLSNIHRPAAFLRKSGVTSESDLLCHKSSKILSAMTKTWEKLPRVPTSGYGTPRNVLNVGCH